MQKCNQTMFITELTNGRNESEKVQTIKKTKRFDLVLHKSTRIQKSKQTMFTTELTN